MPNVNELLKEKLTAEHYKRLMAVDNIKIHEFTADAIELTNPETVFVCTDSEEDIRYVREMAVKSGEEHPLETPGHTYHFDGFYDQGRDREVTRYLVPKSETLSKALNQIQREEGLSEVRGLLKDSMKGRTMILRFLSLGPKNSVFSIPCVQATDSWYVAHSEDLLYRIAYEHFCKIGKNDNVFCFLHSAGELSENMTSVDVEHKRVYMDYTQDTIYSVNTQYGGNTMGLKKLALRLTIRKADREGWLAEHMFISGVYGPGGRKTYLAGAFPSGCGKTSTAMLPRETIMGDDIAYFRNVKGEFRAVNAEAGIFGIIQNVNAQDDPVIWNVLHSPGEVIISNILVSDKKPYWLGMGEDTPDRGINFSGKWFKGKKDAKGNEISLAHKNARYTVALKALANCDPELDNPDGVVLGGLMYGGRDSKAYVPVQQSFDWAHGIVLYAASLETETTFAIIGKEGVIEINLMSIQDFLAIPQGKYIQNNIDFAKGIKKPPLVFGVNYFLRDEKGKFVNGVRDKHVWVKWMEFRIHGDVDALTCPTGQIPHYDDLVKLFKQVLDKKYTKDDYVKQFTIRVPENLAKIERVEKYHRENVLNSPQIVYDTLAATRKRLNEARDKHGDYISPFDLMAQ
ncbi:MAG TPA: phosphoenolpyruvate carboxykinase (GTP) [Sedimentisphaerales bacterium]|nr:phosphoenolpyruvate carboxykinase (GTP) [Sedimentisphaerales bacterium]